MTKNKKNEDEIGWTWERVVALNKLICKASGQPHAIRQKPIWADRKSKIIRELNTKYIRPDEIAKEHYFVEGNKRTASCLAICLTLEEV